MRNYALIVLGLNSALRISDILRLRWEDVYDFEEEMFRSHVSIVSRKPARIRSFYSTRTL
jgi:integrase